MRVAIVGGTGPFGRALATRLHESGLEVVVGSRDAARAEAAGLELDCTGATNAEASGDADFIILAVTAEAALDTARELRQSIGSTPLLSVASELSFSKDGVFPTPEAVSLAERIRAEVDAPVVAGLHSLAASSLGRTTRRTRMSSSAATTSTRRQLRSSSPLGSPPDARSTPARSRALAHSRA